MYHFTDLPSFVSGEHLVMFDPHTKYVPGATHVQPGIKVKGPAVPSWVCCGDRDEWKGRGGSVACGQPEFRVLEEELNMVFGGATVVLCVYVVCI